MPKRFIKYSRTEPARTILFSVALLTFLMQALFLGFNFEWLALPNLALVGALSFWAVRACAKNLTAQMSTSSFWVFIVWLWSALNRLLFSPDPTQFLWFPMLIVAMAMSVVYIYLSAQKKQGH